MADLAELERRVTALEAAQRETAETQTWMASTLGRIASVQDEHTARLDRIEGEISSLRRDLPGMLADAVREGIKPQQ